MAHFDIMRLDCDDLKRGLASKAHGYAETLLTRLAEDHRKENQRSDFPLAFICYLIL